MIGPCGRPNEGPHWPTMQRCKQSIYASVGRAQRSNYLLSGGETLIEVWSVLRDSLVQKIRRTQDSAVTKEVERRSRLDSSLRSEWTDLKEMSERQREIGESSCDCQAQLSACHAMMTGHSPQRNTNAGATEDGPIQFAQTTLSPPWRSTVAISSPIPLSACPS
jgi:hypothetical protein